MFLPARGRRATGRLIIAKGDITLDSPLYLPLVMNEGKTYPLRRLNRKRRKPRKSYKLLVIPFLEFTGALFFYGFLTAVGF